MKFFKDNSGVVFAFATDGSEDKFIGDDLTPITEDEADVLRAPRLTKNVQLLLINAEFESLITLINEGYPPAEVLSWTKQETEARAWISDHNASTPLLDSLSAARSIDKSELAARIIAKADTFTQYSGALIGKRQALEDALNALPEDATADQIAAITW